MPSRPPAVRIRRALPRDLLSLLALEQSCFRHEQLSPRRMRHWLTADNGILLVASAGGELLGYSLTLTRRDSPAARLYSLAIAAHARGQGLARRLLARTERCCRQRGCRTLRLEVARGNRAAIQLYQARGFRQFGIHHAYYQDGQDALRMTKELEP